VNSVGKLPIEFLENTELYKAEAAFNNALEILAQYKYKEDAKRRTEIGFRAFSKLVDLEVKLKSIRNDLSNQAYDAAELKSFELIDLALEGLRYYQTYLYSYKL
jgi:phosphatidylinositol glycan class N